MWDSLFLAQQSTSGGIGGIIFLLIYLAIIVLMIAGLWMTFEKAGQPGWGAIVPIYNVILLIKIAGKPIWWIILFFIPIVNFVVSILVVVGIAQNFGKGVGYILGLLFLPFIFYPMLGFGSAQYSPQG